MDLVAQGETRSQRWRKRLPERVPIILGRTTSGWSVPWDDHISRRHAQLTLRHETLEVTRIESSRNPIFVRGKETLRAELHAGEHFVIGGTTFTLTDAQSARHGG